MYHISDDIRAQKSARRICESLMECAKHKPFSEITVSDLNKEYDISRTTFTECLITPWMCWNT